MLQYDWGSGSSSNSQPVQFIDETGSYEPDPTRTIYNHYPFNNTEETHFISSLNPFHSAPHNHQTTNHHLAANATSIYDAHHQYGSYPPLTLEPTGFPKPEPTVSGFEWGGATDNNAASSSRLGLNLGGRTFYAEDDFVNRLYRRSRMLEPGPVNAPRCQAEGCNADLSYAKHYHKRHKVCEFHSKAATVIANGLTQRFCQQCSRFHLLSEFDNGKRSCRKRLADHNRRRRKSQQPNQECNNNKNNNTKNDDDNANKSQLDQKNDVTHSSSENAPRSPPYSKAHTSSVTIAISPPRISLDCFGHRSYNDNGTSALNSSTSLLFYSNG